MLSCVICIILKLPVQSKEENIFLSLKKNQSIHSEFLIDIHFVYFVLRLHFWAAAPKGTMTYGTTTYQECSTLSSFFSLLVSAGPASWLRAFQLAPAGSEPLPAGSEPLRSSLTGPLPSQY